MTKETIDDLSAKRLCHHCVGEAYLSAEIEAKGKRRKCSYCGITAKAYQVGEVAGRIDQAFAQHYTRTSDQPDDWQYSLMRDRESRYEWERDGESVVFAIMNAAEIPQAAAEDIQRILDEQYSDFDAAAMGEETEFGDETYYAEKGANDQAWQEDWRAFEHALKTKARFFSRTAARHLASIFDGIAVMRTIDARPLVVDAGPGTLYHAFFRARVFQSDESLIAALCRPDLQLGPPPARLANAGRMNARGIAVFYGANDPAVAIAEVRPPVGSQVLVARFDILRPLRLLDLTALGAVAMGGSIFDPKLAECLERAMFLRSLSQRITRPVMPDDEALDYLPTQAVADFLATEAEVPLDGILYPSVQAAGNALNCVLFHKAALVEHMSIPDGAEIRAHRGGWGEDGWEFDYSVTEEVPPQPEPKGDSAGDWPTIDAFIGAASEHADHDDRQPTLRLAPDTVTAHIVQRVQVDTEHHSVYRHRREKISLDF